MKEVKDFSKEFKEIKKYKWIGLLWIVGGTFLMPLLIRIQMFFLEDNQISIVLTVIPSIISVIIGCVYLDSIKCPYCGHKFDSREWLMHINWCPGCGVKLREF